MKKIVPIILIFLALPITVLALYGGDTLTYNIPTCNWLTTNISNAQLGEWNVSPSCIEQSAGNFYCNCTSGEILSLTPKANSVGTFNINITYYWEAQGGGGGGGSSNIYFPYVPSGKNTTINVTQTIETIKEVIVNKTVEIPVNQTVEKIVEKVPQIFWYYLIIAILISFAFGLFVCRLRKKEKKEIPKELEKSKEPEKPKEPEMEAPK